MNISLTKSELKIISVVLANFLVATDEDEQLEFFGSKKYVNLAWKAFNHINAILAGGKNGKQE
jgi:hypothetical protein